MAALFLGVVASLPAQDETPGVEIKKLVPRKKTEKKGDEIFRKVDTLKATDPTDPVRRDCYVHIYSRRMEFGRVYMIEMNQSGGSGVNPYLRLEDSRGTTHSEDDNGGGSLNARIAFAPPATGEYKISATTTSPRQTGEYEFKVSPLPPGTSMPGVGMAAPIFSPVDFGKIRVTAHPLLADVNNQNGRYGYVEYRFTIENDEEKDSHAVTLTLPTPSHYNPSDGLSLTLRRTQVVGPQMSATISLFQPCISLNGTSARVTIDGRPMTDAVPCPVATQRGPAHGHMYGGYTKSGPADGKVPVLCTVDLVHKIGGIAFNWAQEKLRLDSSRGPEDPTVDVFRKVDKLKSTDPIDAVRPNCYVHTYTRNLEAGKTYSIELNQSGGTSWDPYLRLEDSRGVMLTQDDDGGGSLNSRINFRPTATDDYKIYVTTCSPRQVGEYELIVATPPRTTTPTAVNSPLGLVQAFRTPADWSSSWLAYTPFAGIAVPGKALEEAPHEVRTAIFRYVESGGALLVTETTNLPATWVVSRKIGNAAVYNPGFGQCIMANDWSACQDVKVGAQIQEMYEASHRAFDQVTSLNDAHRQFPVVENSGVPVRGLFVFMFLFVLIIGPVNIFWLARTNRRIWLLWTVPAIALVTGSMLFAYMRITEGWYGHVRSLSVTVLDENSQRAVTASWLGYYSPATHGSGMHYSATAEVTPQNQRDWNPYRGGGGDSQPVSIDWTDDQHFASGWITPRVPLHMLVRNNVKSELRVTVTESGGKPASAVNLLGVPIAKLYVGGADKMIYTADDVAPGAKITLLPGNAASKSPIPIRTGYSGRWLDFASKLENSPGSYLRPNTYIAVIDEGSPFLDDGSATTQSRKTKAVVYGILPTGK